MEINREELPSELIKELRSAPCGRPGGAVKALRGAIKTILEEQGPTDLNNILVGLWRSEGKVFKRSYVAATISLMVKSGEVTRPSRGVCALPPSSGGVRPPAVTPNGQYLTA